MFIVLLQLSKQQSKNVQGRAMKREYYHAILRILTDNIRRFALTGVSTIVDGHLRTLYPRLAFIGADWPEAQQICGCFNNASNVQCVCRFCFLPRLYITHIPIIRDAPLRTEKRINELRRRYALLNELEARGKQFSQRWEPVSYQ